MSEQTKCELCGEPMPPGEQMFKFHGYSGPCPKPFINHRPGEMTMLIDHMLQELVDEHQHTAHHGFTASAGHVTAAAAKATLGDVLKKLRANGVPWANIFALIGPILNMIFAGTPIGAIVAAILAILQPPVPTP